MIKHTNQPAAPVFGRFLTLNEVAELLGVCKRTISREIARGKFPKPVRIGRVLRFALSDVEAYAAGLHSSK